VRENAEEPDGTSNAAQLREEKLQNDLFVLRQLNGAFAVYNDALREAQAGTERIAEQLEQTDALLNKYVDILSKTDQVARLIFDGRWMGAEADEAQLEEEERVREEARRREEEERQRGRSENGSGGKGRSSSVRCAMKRNGWSARRGTEGVRGLPVVECGASVERVRLCVPVPLRRGVSRGQHRPRQLVSAAIQGHQAGPRVPRKSPDRRRLCPRHGARLVFHGACRNDPNGGTDLSYTLLRFFVCIIQYVCIISAHLYRWPDLHWTIWTRATNDDGAPPERSTQRTHLIRPVMAWCSSCTALISSIMSIMHRTCQCYCPVSSFTLCLLRS